MEMLTARERKTTYINLFFFFVLTGEQWEGVSGEIEAAAVLHDCERRKFVARESGDCGRNTNWKMITSGRPVAVDLQKLTRRRFPKALVGERVQCFHVAPRWWHEQPYDKKVCADQEVVAKNDRQDVLPEKLSASVIIESTRPHPNDFDEITAPVPTLQKLVQIFEEQWHSE